MSGCEVVLEVTTPGVVVEQPATGVVLETSGQGPPGPAGPGAPVTTIQTDSDVLVGSPVYLTGSSTVDLAQADALGTSHVLGLALTAVLAGFATQVAGIGPVTQADWSSVAGAAALTPGAQYFLDALGAGMLTTNPPLGGGDQVVRVGTAINSTTMDVHVHRPIGKA